jgi:tellurite resistance protein
MIDRIRSFFSPEQRRVIGHEAKQLLENKHLRDAFDAVDGYLADAARSCDPDNREKAQRVIISMQLLEAIKREITRKIEDGEIAQIEIAEIERRTRPAMFRR